MTPPSYIGPTEVRRCTDCRTVLEVMTADGFDRDGFCTTCERITEKQPVSDPVADAFRKGWDV